MNAQRADDDAVLARALRGVGHLTLNRPRAINALGLDMIRDLAVALDRWKGDTDIELVLLDGAGERGFCAGGDVRALHGLVVDGLVDDVHTYFREEYALDHLIATYPKPVVAIADGVTMGGGIGVSVHGKPIIVSESALLAMPETAIAQGLRTVRWPARLQRITGHPVGLTGDNGNFVVMIVNEDERRSIGPRLAAAIARRPAAQNADPLSPENYLDSFTRLLNAPKDGHLLGGLAGE